jgi:hypothetical protein
MSRDISQHLSWPEKVFKADAIWAQLKEILSAAGHVIAPIPRRPDIRLVINNVSSNDFSFQNPGDHSNSKPEVIPSTGSNTAAMIMLKGESLVEQYNNAAALVERFRLNSDGLTSEFVDFIGTDDASTYIKEAYGPASFTQQSTKLTDINWMKSDGSTESIKPVFHDHYSFGARAPTQEIAFTTTMCVYVQGTNSTPEVMDIAGMVIAVSAQDDTQTTRPIAPAVAKDFYGQSYETMPIVTVNTDGQIQKIDLRNGTIIDVATDQSAHVRHIYGAPTP